MAHGRKVVVTVGASGISPALLEEIDAALKRHELLKIRLSNSDRNERQQQLALICDHSHAHSIQRIGKVGVIYRRGEPARIDLS